MTTLGVIDIFQLIIHLYSGFEVMKGSEELNFMLNKVTFILFRHSPTGYWSCLHRGLVRDALLNNVPYL